MSHLSHPSPASAGAALRARTAALVALFDEVGKTRMHGVPILNPALKVEEVGFEVSNRPVALIPPAQAAPDCVADHAPPGAVGILVTPWFMNLVWFPLLRTDEPDRAGSQRAHAVGAECFDFIAGYEAGFGSYEACSLFSPMFEFSDQATAIATAHAVLAELRRPPEPTPAPVSAPVARLEPGVAGRRAFLLGRRSPPAGVAP